MLVRIDKDDLPLGCYQTEESVIELINLLNERDIFHVHTYRCGHAGDELDELYVQKAIELGAQGIVFTDHCPFPGNPFGNRMDIEELPEYIATLKDLKEKYAGQIDVRIGLEVEYLPSYKEYYKQLYESKQLDYMMIGQHFYEKTDGGYSFSDKDKSREFVGLCDAIVEGIKTGFFNVVAHPDRSFRGCKEWTQEMQVVADQIIQAAREHGVALEENYASKRKDRQYWEQFWINTTNMYIRKGCDAHSVAEMEERWKQIVGRR